MPEAAHDVTDTSPLVVVGVDGSKPGAEAVEWALAEARLRGARLRVVHAWHPSAGYGYPYAITIPIGVFEDAARDCLAESTRDLDGEGTLGIETALVCGSAAQVLLEASAHADLVVVGSRGHGGFAGLLLGSVSQQLVQHATCPVVIVHPKR